MLALTIWGALYAALAPRALAQETAAAVPAAPGAPAAPAPSEAMNADARAHYDRGLALYAEKDYPGAIAELQAGYALDPRREFLFAEAQARRLSGDCKNAVPLYQRFLAGGPDDVQVNATQIALGRCAAQMASAPPTPAPERPRALQVPAVTVPARPPAPPPPWYQDLAGGALLGAGGVGIATGVVATLGMYSARDDANQKSGALDQFAAHWDTARSRQRIAIVGFAAGAALTGAAIIRYVRVRARPLAGKLEAWVAPGEQGAVAGVGGRF